MSQQQYRCRGLRRWCGRRCEASDSAPPANASLGYHCGLHSYQMPKMLPDGSLLFEHADVEEHVRRRTSFVAPESLVALELLKAPELVRDRPGAPSSITALGVINYLMERRSLSEEGARAYAERMVAQGILVPVASSGGAPRFSASDRASLYRVKGAGQSMQQQQQGRG